MQRNIDKWIYTIECANPEGNEDLSKDPRFNTFGWKWSKGYDSVDVIGKLYTRGEAVDMVFNKHYTFVKYLATQHLPWENGVVSFMKNTALERQVMTLEEIWEKLPDVPTHICSECYGSCSSCVYRKIDLDEKGKMVKKISCLYDINDEMLQSMATNYLNKEANKTEGLLLHTTVAKPQGLGIDVPSNLGDYYYLEALMRATRDWKSYW